MKTICCAVLVLFAAAVSAQANATTGSVAFDTPTLVRADASPTGNINTATMFDLEGLATTDNASGIFAGLPNLNFGNVSFASTVGSSFNVSDGLFGAFDSHTITVIHNTPGFLNLLFFGHWAPGTFNPDLKCPLVGCDAVFRISMTQTPVTTGEISMSGTMSTNITVVPEPTTALLFLTGIGMVFGGAKLRRLLLD